MISPCLCLQPQYLASIRDSPEPPRYEIPQEKSPSSKSPLRIYTENSASPNSGVHSPLNTIVRWTCRGRVGGFASHGSCGSASCFGMERSKASSSSVKFHEVIKRRISATCCTRGCADHKAAELRPPSHCPNWVASDQKSEPLRPLPRRIQPKQFARLAARGCFLRLKYGGSGQVLRTSNSQTHRKDSSTAIARHCNTTHCR